MKEQIFVKNNFTVYKIGSMYYFNDGQNEYNFIPYIVNGEKIYAKNEMIYDLSDFIEHFNKYCPNEDIEPVLELINKYHIEDIKRILEKIEWIKQQKFGQEENKDNKEETTKRKRKVKIPLQYCKSIKEIPEIEDIKMINYYSSKIDGKEYLFDIISTKQGHFYVNVVDITNEYNEIDFYDFKDKYCQPTLFDDFFEI